VVRFFGPAGRPKLREILSAVLALIVVWSGILAGCVFLLTSPPAIELLSDHALALIGLISLIVCIAVGLREISSIFFPRGGTRR
jgi:hypothetical protein